ncbi:AAA family ATPase [Photobacterium leiognathi]|uniref:AAA family ATPase n=1 Tax=Photobacterium leiognathi TaxID=553611 RepID=UPI002739830F|nr:AAA family ATPase [Photobacterium leiognathi]
MLLIERVKIIGFKSATTIVDARLSGSNVSIIYGDNGCGKTTFLKVLHAVLSQDESILIQNNIESVLIEYSNNNYIHKVTISKFLEDEYNWSELLESDLGDSLSLSLGVDRGVINKGLSIEPRYIFEFFRAPRRRMYLNSTVPLSQVIEELTMYLRNIQTLGKENNFELDFEKRHLYLQNIQIDNIEELLVEKYRLARVTATRRIQSALFDTLSVAISIDNQPKLEEDKIPYDFDILLYENADRIIEALDDGEDNQFKNTVIDILSNLHHESDVERIKRNPILSHLFLNIIEELKFEKLILSSINLLIDTFNDYLMDGKKLIVNNHQAYIRFGFDEHSLNELSSGERHMLTFLSLVLFEGGKRNFVIIDEPEISLNIKWQRELIPLFKKLIPETQIIVASHSPSLANNNIEYLCELELDYVGNL